MPTYRKRSNFAIQLANPPIVALFADADDVVLLKRQLVALGGHVGVLGPQTLQHLAVVAGNQSALPLARPRHSLRLKWSKNVRIVKRNTKHLLTFHQPLGFFSTTTTVSPLLMVISPALTEA
jgi:hypothetical protein